MLSPVKNWPKLWSQSSLKQDNKLKISNSTPLCKKQGNSLKSSWLKWFHFHFFYCEFRNSSTTENCRTLFLFIVGVNKEKRKKKENLLKCLCYVSCVVLFFDDENERKMVKRRHQKVMLHQKKTFLNFLFFFWQGKISFLCTSWSNNDGFSGCIDLLDVLSQCSFLYTFFISQKNLHTNYYMKWKVAAFIPCFIDFIVYEKNIKNKK